MCKSFLCVCCVCVHVHVQIHAFICVCLGGRGGQGEGEGREKGRAGRRGGQGEEEGREKGRLSFLLPPSAEPGGVSDMRLGQSRLLSVQCSSPSQSDQSDSSLTAAPAQYDVMVQGL